MPLVALAPATRASRLSTAAARWDAMRAGRPDLLPALALQTELIGLVVDLADAGEAADHIHSLIAEGRLEAGSLLAASLARDQQSIRTGAIHRGVAPDLLW